MGKLFSSLSCLLTPYKPHPYHVQWFLTGKCNYRCRTCQIWSQPQTRELTVEEVKRGIDILHAMGVVDLVFTGGNPLLRGDIAEILKYAHPKFPLVTIYDNGSLASKKLDILRHADRVCISLHSLNPALQNAIAGVPNAFREAMQSILLLKKKGLGVVVAVTVAGNNIHEVPALIEYFGEREIPVILALYSDLSSEDSLVKIGTPDPCSQFHDGESLRKFFQSLRELKRRYPVHLDFKTLEALEAFFSEGRRNWQCQALSSFFMVNELGWVSGCHVMPPVCRLGELPSLWGSEKFAELRENCKLCEKCLYLCYVAYSHIRRARNLAEYLWDYKRYMWERFLLTLSSEKG
ncbi:radical SAM protein [Candidatus Hecatella orcuttiae]|uniref:radical SAM protein n=1 Tax=Candidatus Hecatella orcuttiae TaxID=1935119 RepID=UPI0028681707|nr:radical SAM protein [Candidatus Hecatella orcuttiae]